MSLTRQLLIQTERNFPRLFCLLLFVRDRLRPDGGEAEIALLPRLCDSRSAALDIGANHGDYAAALLRSAGRVTAFEPNPRLARILALRFGAARRQGRLAIVQAAVSDHEGSIGLFIPRRSSALASVTAAGERLPQQPGDLVTVPMHTLDGFVQGPVDFIKIDVEGHETAVLAGAMETIRRQCPSLLIEVEERHHPGGLAKISGDLEALGYQGFFLMDGRLRPLADFDAKRLQDVTALDADSDIRIGGRTYINNFLFVQRPAVLSRLSDLIAA